jgi:sulfite reductase alpha subunit-like flavoprotein
VRVWVKKGDVRLPSDPTKPVIMVGPGTGLALFKAFLEERSHLAKHGTMTPPDRHLSICLTVLRCALCVVRRVRRVLWAGVAVGENTFYFGCRHEKKDYLYGDLWQEMVAHGHLHRLHTAFSRDQVRPPPDYGHRRPFARSHPTHLRALPITQENKVYVQHRLLENAEHTWNALVNQHAHFYVSGYITISIITITIVGVATNQTNFVSLLGRRSAKQMPKDIKAALKEICKTQGNKTEEEAEEFFQQLRREKRYLEDTWD